MEEKELQQLLIEIICSEVTDEQLDANITEKLTPNVILKLYELSIAHDMAHIVSAALGKLEFSIDNEIMAKFQKQEMLSVYRCERIKYEFEQICKALNEANIIYVPLKGSVIRKYYPYDSMRTSCDIDILVEEEQLEYASNVIVNALQYRCEQKTDHDIPLYSPSGIHLELHYHLTDIEDRLFNDILSKPWEHTKETEQNCREFSDEFLLFYHFSHMAKHFAIGGCGIKPLMDLWVIEHKMKINRNACDSLLLQCGLDKFSSAALSLTDVWFGDKEHTELTLDMQDYIMNAGVYGSLENRIIVSQNKKGGKAKHLFSKIFLTYPQMKIYYPSLGKCPPLFPFYQIRRWFRIAFNRDRAKNAMDHIKTSNLVSDERSKHIMKLCNRLGI